MAAAEVRLLVGRYEVVLGADLEIVPASQLVISVSGARSRNVLLDGRAVRLSSGSAGLLSVDLVRSTGFHNLIVDGVRYWFGTEDAKLGLDGVVAMLDELRTMGTGWTGQAMFSDGTGLRDPHVSYGWLDQYADEALRAVSAILGAPRSSLRATRVLRRRGGAGVLLAPTLRLLRSDPRRYLAPAEGGVIQSNGVSYEPLRVVTRKRESTLHTIANRRAVSVLGWVLRLTQEVILASENADAITRSRLWSNQARALQHRPLAQSLGVQKIPLDPRQPEETTDPSYRTAYAIARDLATNFAWNASDEPKSRLSYVEQSDVIYQTYTASRIAKELGLHQSSRVLGAVQPAFVGEHFDLYYDTQPPAEILRSWRWYSDRPDQSRPDLLLYERATGRVAVMDAKYRISREGRASEDSLKDVSAYMGLYGLKEVSILYPGRTVAETAVSGHDRRILELAIAPALPDMGAAANAILATLRVPAF